MCVREKEPRPGFEAVTLPPRLQQGPALPPRPVGGWSLGSIYTDPPGSKRNSCASRQKQGHRGQGAALSSLKVPGGATFHFWWNHFW